MADYGDEHARRAREEGGKRRASVPPLDMGMRPGALLMTDDQPKQGRRPVIASMLDDQQGQLYKLSELISQLGDIITPAMRPENPNGEGMSDGETPEMSEVARSIDNNTDIVKAMQRRIQDYIDRVEV